MSAVASPVYVLPLSGNAEQARATAERLYADTPVVLLQHRELREGGWKQQLRSLRRLRGRALIFYFQSLADLYQERLLACTGLIHHCRETTFADDTGRVRRYGRRDWLQLLPALALSVLADAFVFARSWASLRRGIATVQPADFSPGERTIDIVYLFPFPLNRYTVGGAMTHVRGVLRGLNDCGVRLRVFYAGLCPAEGFPSQEIPSTRRWFLFWESLLLSFNVTFARAVQCRLRGEKVGAMYQRHGRFVIAGALLSRALRVPLILEYNGSEQWTARHWDPSRFVSWLRLCERYMLRASSCVVVVSEALKTELVEAGVAPERILVNPNAVDPQQFHPDCGGAEIRARLGFSPGEVVVGFLSTYSYFHGVKVLQSAIREISRETGAAGPRVRFLLLGEGALWQEMRDELKDLAACGAVVLTGAVPHQEVPAYLDAADILVSPHVPMPDGRPFFGSPTKLFEYMAMGKAIVASDLDQIGQVLKHDESAWLVPPGSARDVAAAIRLLAADPERRWRLGQAARQAVLQHHTWSQNARRLLDRMGLQQPEVITRSK